VANPDLIWLIPLAPLVGCIVCTLLSLAGDKRLAHIPALLSLLIAAVATLLVLVRWSPAGSEAGYLVSAGYSYLQVGGVNLSIALRVDALALTLLSVVTPISALIAIYSKGYISGDPGYARYFAVFCGFVFCMTMLVLSHNLLMMYIFWEGVGTCSYLLIGFWFRRPSAARAATKAFLVNRVADTAFLLGITLLSFSIGQTEVGSAAQGIARLDFQTIFAAIPELAEKHADVLTLIAFLLMTGAIGKSAQFPFHVWLPDAMEGPTPVSALIHAATMVTAGVFLLARLAPLTAMTPTVLVTVAWLGGITALLAALMALCQSDLKRVLAYSTVSQLGFLFMALGTGAVQELMTLAVVAAMFHLLTHAFFKALLFLSAGNVMHAMGDVIDMNQFSGLKRVLPFTNLCFAIGAAALAGVPLLSGFFSKDGIFGVLVDASSDPVWGQHFSCLLMMGWVTAGLTAIYTSKAYFRTFHGQQKVPAAAGDHPHEAGWIMLAPMFVLAAGSVLAGALLGPTGVLSNFVSKTPFLHHHEHQEPLWLLITSSALAIAGIFLGWRLSRSTFREGGVVDSLAELGRNRLFIDWLYENAIVEPYHAFARGLSWFDERIVGAMTAAVAGIPGFMGGLGQRWQTGRISTYSLLSAFGIVVVAVWFIFQGNW